MAFNPETGADREQRMLGRLREKMTSKVGHRADLYLGDFRSINKITAQLLIGYDDRFGVPTGNHISEFMVKSFEGKVVPQMATAKVHNDIEAISVVAEIYRPTRRMDEAENMTCIASTLYVDSDMGETWEVMGDETSKFLARVMKDDIGAILNERRKRMASQFTGDVCLANALSAGINQVEEGALVRFYWNAKVLQGEVTQVMENGVRINAEDGGTFTVPREAVTEVLRWSDKTESNLKEKLGQYFSEAYGFKDYGQQIARDLNGKYR
jgi:hypothetical protein